MNATDIRTEDVFELYVEYLFANTSSLKISNYLRKPKKRIDEGIMYKLLFNRQFPSIDFVLLMDGMYYSIPVSFITTREEHVNNERVDDRIKRAKEILGIDGEMIYVYFINAL